MSDLRPTSPVAGLDATNLRKVLEDMGRGPGWYTSAELHTWYASMARDAGLEAMTRNAFGRALTELGFRASIRRRDRKLTRVWFMSARAWRA